MEAQKPKHHLYQGFQLSLAAIWGFSPIEATCFIYDHKRDDMWHNQESPRLQCLTSKGHDTFGLKSHYYV